MAAQVKSPWQAHGLATVLALVVAAAGTALALTSALRLHDAEQRAAEQRFDRHVERIEIELQQRFGRVLHGLNGARSALHAAPAMGREGFRRYVLARDLAREFTGIRGIGLIERVPRGELADFLARERADGEPGFAVRGAGDADDLLVIKVIEPRGPNLPALGFDIGSEALRRAAAERALSTGRPALTAPVVLVQDAHRGFGLLYLVPVAAPGQEHRLVYAPIVLDELLDGLTAFGDGQVDIAVSVADSDPLFVTDDGRPTTEGEPPQVPLNERTHRRLHRIDIGGQPILVRSGSTPRFDASVPVGTPRLIGAAGVALSLSLALAGWLLLRGRQRALALAARMTLDLDRLAMVARRTSNAVVITDARRRITWVNEGFERITGYRAAEVMGRVPGDVLQGPGTDAGMVKRMRDALHAGEGFRGELLNFGRDGRSYWLDIEIQPLRGADGTLAGFMAVETDVTLRRELEDALRQRQVLLQSVLDNLPGGLTVFDGELKLVASNRQVARLLDLPQRLLEPGTPFADIVRFNAERGEYGPGDPAALAREAIERARRPTPHLFERQRPDGTVIEVRGGDMPGGGFVTTYTDVTARRTAQTRLQATTAMLQGVLEAAADVALVATDRHGRVTLFNRGAERLLARRRDDVVGRLTLDRLFRDDELATRAAPGQQGFAVLAADARLGRRDDWTCLRGDGGTVPAALVVTAISDDQGQVSGYLALLTDLTERQAQERALRQMAFVDALTGVANRRSFDERLQLECARAARSGQPLALLMIDIDHFKAYNDRCGHLQGDDTLRAVARVLAGVLKRPADLLARYGGEEFAAVLPDTDARGTAALVAELLQAVRDLARPHPAVASGRVSVSIGAAMWADEAAAVGVAEPAWLLRRADEALYAAKAAGRDRAMLVTRGEQDPAVLA